MSVSEAGTDLGTLRPAARGRLDPDDCADLHRASAQIRAAVRDDDLSGAETNDQAAVKIFEEMGNKGGLAKAYGQIATILEMREPERAVAFCLQSLAIDREIGRKEGMASSLTCLGRILARRGQLTRALEHLYEARSLFGALGRADACEEVESIINVILQARGRERQNDGD